MNPDRRLRAGLVLTARAAAAGVAFLTPARRLLAELRPGELPVPELVGLAAGLFAWAVEVAAARAGPGVYADGVAWERRGVALLGLLCGLVPLALWARTRDPLLAEGLSWAVAAVSPLVALAPALALRAVPDRPFWRGLATPLAFLAGALALGAAVLTPTTPRLTNTAANAFLVFLLCSYVEFRNPRRDETTAPAAERLRSIRLGGWNQFQLYFLLTVLTFVLEPFRPGLGLVALGASTTLYWSLFLRAGTEG